MSKLRWYVWLEVSVKEQGMEWEVFGGKSEQRGKGLGCRGHVCVVFLQELISS